MPRFYCPVPLSTGITISLPDAVAHHVQVLRLAEGSTITLFNADGGSHDAVLTRVEKRRAEATIGGFRDEETELPYTLTLAQALPEASKMDWIIEKSVELGVKGIQPLAAQRCVVRLAAERAEKKQAHWQGIIVAATEQCGRNRLAGLSPVADFRRWLAQDFKRPLLLLSPRADQTLAQWASRNTPQDVILAIGPEGGFTDMEEDAAVSAGAITVSMGPRILRTETAGLAAVASLNALWSVKE